MFYLQKGNVFAVPILHYNMEMAQEVLRAFYHLKPACVAVELPETLSLQMLHAASRLPDLSMVSVDTYRGEKLYFPFEVCDGICEALRSALENQIPAFCIDLDLDDYPEVRDPFPDPYAVFKIGLEAYYKLYTASAKHPTMVKDTHRELHMARKLKELSLRHDSVLFVGGMLHADAILKALDLSSYPTFQSVARDMVYLTTPSETSVRAILGESGWISTHYERAREQFLQGNEEALPLDRQKLIYNLYKEAGKKYTANQGASFPGYHLRNIMKFGRNYALLSGRLLPDLFQLLSSAKACVDHNYAYEVWELSTDYPYYRNIDGFPEEELTPEDVWGHSKRILFHLREKSRKAFLSSFRKKDKSRIKLYPPGPFTICSYPPEDLIIENFGQFLQKKGTQLLSEEGARTIPFTTSIEDGIDMRETIRHFSEGLPDAKGKRAPKLYVKTRGKPPGGVGSVVVIFDEDAPIEGERYEERYPWLTTWLGEHNQESDMAFYATHMALNVIGPGISRCEYGGFLMSYPPRRLMDVWHDPDYSTLRTKAEILLAAAIDYSQRPLIVYVAAKPPRSQFKSFARRFGKKVVFIPIGQLSPVTLQKLKSFHVLDSYEKRDIAGEYIT
jgi:hypothetical protein